MRKSSATPSTMLTFYTFYTSLHPPPSRALQLTRRRLRLLDEFEQAGNVCDAKRSDPDAPALQQDAGLGASSDLFEQALDRPASGNGEAPDDGRQVAVQKDADADFRFEEHRTRVVEERRFGGAHGGAGVREQPLTRVVEPVYPGRVVERHEHALRTILEIPAALFIGRVIPADELPDRGVGDAFEAPRYALDLPVPAAVEREPAVHRRHVRPLQHAADHDVVHRPRRLTQP